MFHSYSYDLIKSGVVTSNSEILDRFRDLYQDLIRNEAVEVRPDFCLTGIREGVWWKGGRQKTPKY